LQALICCPEQTIIDRSKYPGKGCMKKKEREEEERGENNTASDNSRE
jgi:hypothetical protein